MSDCIIDVNSLCFGYHQEDVLENVTFQVQRGEYVALLGPNGGGKTTLLKLMLGLLTPRDGSIRIFGDKPGRVIRRIGYVPQNTDLNPAFPISVEQVVLLGIDRRRLSPGPFYTKSQKSQVQAALEQVRIQHLSSLPIQQLSGGELQRVLIARALVNKPELLIFDEPTSNVDPHGTYCFYELLGELNKSLTVVLVSHDLGVTAAIIDSVACVNKRVIYHDEPELTAEMLSLMYGVHADDCPMSVYLSDLSNFVHQHNHPANA